MGQYHVMVNSMINRFITSVMCPTRRLAFKYPHPSERADMDSKSKATCWAYCSWFKSFNHASERTDTNSKTF